MSSSPMRILVAWRPGAEGLDSVAHAAWLARTHPVRIRFAAVVSRGWPLTSLARLGADDRWVREVSHATAKDIRRAAKRAGLRKPMLDDADPVRIIESSSEATAITAAAAEFDADLILLGSRVGGPEGRFRAGATADALLHFSPIPLGLSIPAATLSKRGVTRVSCSYIDTAQSHGALERAADLARAWEVPLRLLAFTPAGATMYPTAAGYGSAEDLMVEWHEQALALLDRGRDRALTRHPELRVQADVGSGDGWAGAIGAVKWKKGDLLLLGSSTLGPFGRVFTGSSTNHIIRHAPVPMMITPS